MPRRIFWFSTCRCQNTAGLHATDTQHWFVEAFASLTTLLFVFLIDRFQPALECIERIAHGYVEVFMGVIVMLIARDDEFVIGNRGFDTDVVYLAFVMIVVRSLQYHSQALDFITESLQFCYSLVDGFFYSRRVVDIAKENLGIAYHACASCTPFSGG